MSESDTLRKPEDLHVALNHLTIYGVRLGALAWLIALVLRGRAAPITALALTKGAAVSASPVLLTGQRPYKMAGPVLIPFLALSCLAGCASSAPPPLGADNPASPLAPAARTPPLPHTLAPDALTQKVHQSLARTAQAQPPGDQSGPGSGASHDHPMQAMPGMNMPGMKMAPQPSAPSPTPTPP